MTRVRWGVMLAGAVALLLPVGAPAGALTPPAVSLPPLPALPVALPETPLPLPSLPEQASPADRPRTGPRPVPYRSRCRSPRRHRRRLRCPRSRRPRLRLPASPSPARVPRSPLLAGAAVPSARRPPPRAQRAGRPGPRRRPRRARPRGRPRPHRTRRRRLEPLRPRGDGPPEAAIRQRRGPGGRACRAQGRLVAAGIAAPGLMATTVTPSGAGSPSAARAVAPARPRPGRLTPRRPRRTSRRRSWTDVRMVRLAGGGRRERGRRRGAGDTLWLALLAGVGLVALMVLAARAVQSPSPVTPPATACAPCSTTRGPPAARWVRPFPFLLILLLA